MDLAADHFPGLHDVGQLHRRRGNYWTSAAFFQRAQEYSCGTSDPNAADLYFVPVFNDSPAPEPCEPTCRDAIHEPNERRQRHWELRMRRNFSEVLTAASVHCERDALFRRLDSLRSPSGASYLTAHTARHLLHSPRHAELDECFPWDRHGRPALQDCPAASTHMMPCGSFEFSLDDARLRGTTRLAIEALTEHPLRSLRHARGFSSVPSLSYVHAPPATVWSDAPWRLRPPRRLLIAAVFMVKVSEPPKAHSMPCREKRCRPTRCCPVLSWCTDLACSFLTPRPCRSRRLLKTHCPIPPPPDLPPPGIQASRASTGMLQIRKALQRSCLQVEALGVCAMVELDKQAHLAGQMEMADTTRTLGAYWDATFCMHPIGDACVRTGVLDSLLLGCIPVLFHRCQLEQWPWHWGSWAANATLFYDAQGVINGSIDPVHALQAIPTAEIARMQRVISEHAHCLHYRRARSAQPTPEATSTSLDAAADAFDITLEGALWHATHPLSDDSRPQVAPCFCEKMPWPPSPQP